MRLTFPLLIFFLAFQMAAAWNLKGARPELGILPPLPTANATRAMSFGDGQFLYRAFALQLQNAGDTGGRFTPMAQFDMAGVVRWLEVLQALDKKSQLYPMLAVRYFSLTPDRGDIRKLIDFIARDYAGLPSTKWFWQTQAVALARDRVKDLTLALKLSQELRQIGPVLPPGYMWVVNIEAVLLADLGRGQEAISLMQSHLDRYGADKMTPAEKNWARQFIADQAVSNPSSTLK